MDEEERNYCCLLLLLLREGLKKLRLFFIGEWNSQAVGFGVWTDCPQNGADLLTKFNPLHYEYNKVNSGDTKTWDLSLFIKVLLHSSPPFVHIPNIALFNALVCLRETRNELCHTQNGKIASAVFNNLFPNACNALQLFGGTQVDFDKVKEDVQQPWNELMTMVQSCVAQDRDIFARLGNLQQGQQDIMQALQLRNAWEIPVRGIIQMVTTAGLVIPFVAGSAFFLNRFKDDPDTVIRLVQGAIVPAAVGFAVAVKTILQGSFVILVEVYSLQGLDELWKSYQDGVLKDNLEKVIITNELYGIAPNNAKKIQINVTISEHHYQKARKSINDNINLHAGQERLQKEHEKIVPGQECQRQEHKGNEGEDEEEEKKEEEMEIVAEDREGDIKDQAIQHQVEGEIMEGQEGVKQLQEWILSDQEGGHQAHGKISGTVFVRGAIQTVTTGGQVLLFKAGSRIFLNHFKEDPDKVTRLVQEAIVPATLELDLRVKAMHPGTFEIVVEVNSLQGLDGLWERYKDGILKDNLEKLIISDELLRLAPVDTAKIQIDVTISEDDYRKARERIVEYNTLHTEMPDSAPDGKKIAVATSYDNYQKGRKDVIKSDCSHGLELYSAKLKEAIINQTDVQRMGVMTAESVKIDDIFTNLVVHYRKENTLKQKYVNGESEYKSLTDINKCSEIFNDEGEGKRPRMILVSGQPGIGKTMFSLKLVRDSAANTISIPNIRFVYFIKFRQLSLLDGSLINLRELLNLSPLLDDTSMIDETVMEYLCLNSAQLFVLLDGLEEFKDHPEIFSGFELQFPNCSKTKMPVAALISKLIQGKILRCAVIMVTSRPGEANEFSQEIQCDRFVQIKGFSEFQVVGYVQKYFRSKPEEIKNKALDKVQGSEYYMSFGRIPFQCYLMCIYIEWELFTSKRDIYHPATLTEFYSQVIWCIERNYNRALRSLDEESASLAVNKTLDNFARLAALLMRQCRFSFTLEDLKELGFSESEALQITSSSLLFCSPVYSYLPFQRPTYEYGFAVFTLQEYLFAMHIVKNADKIPAQEMTESLKIFISGVLGLKETEASGRLMLELLKRVRDNVSKARILSLRCLYEYGQDKELTTQQLTTNPDNTYWDSDDGKIELSGVTNNDCNPVAMLVDKSAVSKLPSPPHVLAISHSPLTSFGLHDLLPSLAKQACKITTLRLLSCQLDDESAMCLSRYLLTTKITDLTLDGNEISDKGMHYIMDNLPDQLTTLSLNGNRITDVGVQCIMGHHCARQLTTLFLDANPVSEECKRELEQFFNGDYRITLTI